ncbi:alcohol dehydrogenase catalytic domain-containing protein [Consotaella aegiceratis]|uniref:alcohol dehydrogenase catalytic domain-containing protein n=1 Tax=Consotaella aegiceratis TaxID=3097961 RepID=UPI002F418F9E
MRALVFSEPHKMAIEELPQPVAADDQLLIRVRASGICGTDLHIFEGEYTAQYPLVPGHEFSGEVVETGPHCTRFKVGDRVAVEPNTPCNNCPECLRGQHHFCRNMVVPGVNRPGGMAEYAVVAERAAFDIGDLPWEEGALCEPLSCVVRSIERLDPQIGERVLVLGAGPIGLLMARLIRARGVTRIDFLERNPTRGRRVAEMRYGEVFGDLGAVPDRAYDSVADASGSSMLVSEAANRLTRSCGKVLAFGVPAMGRQLAIDHFRLFRDEISIIASYTSLKNSLQAIDLMRSGLIDVSDIVSHRIALSQVPTFIERMQAGDGDLRKVTVTDFAG